MDSNIIVAIISLCGVVLGACIVTFYQYFISRKERVDKFKLASLDKRLAVHQEAYSLLTELQGNIYKSGEILENITYDCRDFWKKNCLYLDERTREAFIECVYDVENYDILESLGEKHDKSKLKIFSIITKTKKNIVEGVNLPSIGLDEDINKLRER